MQAGCIGCVPCMHGGRNGRRPLHASLHGTVGLHSSHAMLRRVLAPRAAQSVVSIADFRRDASGAQLSEGTGSGVVWDTCASLPLAT
jgi:hypothetical protein